MSPELRNFADFMIIVGGFIVVMAIVGSVVNALWLRTQVKRARLLGETHSAPAVDEARLDRLEQAVEAIAVEVERIGEGQRFTTRLLSERLPVRRVAGPDAGGGVLPIDAHRSITPH